MILLENKRASFEYEILDTFTAGIVLEGWEVKSIRAKNANLKSSWIRAGKDNEMWLENCTISRYPYAQGDQIKDRPKKLLLSKREIDRLHRKTKEKGITILPLKIFTIGPHLKCEIGIGKGRKKYEKRQVLKDRTTKREAQQAVKVFNKK